MGNFDLDNYITIHSYTFRLALSVLVLMLMLLLRSVVRKRIKNLSILHSYEAHRLLLIRKITAILFWIVLGVVILTIWGVNLENIWVYIGSFITLVAVAFFAIWSILSNIVAGMLIYIINPFKVDSKLKMFDPEIVATVKNINLIFTELEDEEGVFSVPNNLFFQKPVKILKIN